MSIRSLAKTTQRRWCANAGTQLKSGAIINKGTDTPATQSVKKAKTESSRDMWMLKGDRDSLAAYNKEGRTGGDKGYPYSTPGAMEFDDGLQPSDHRTMLEKVTGLHSVVPRSIPVSIEREKKQNAFRNKITSQKALDKLIGPEEGMVSFIRHDTTMIVEIIGVRGTLTAGLVDQLVGACVQLHNMKEIKGVIFHIRGDLIGDPKFNSDIGPDEALNASAVCQRACMEIMNLPFITICVPDKRIGGMGFDVVCSSDFFFSTPETTYDFSALRNSTTGFMGGTQFLVKKTSVRKALLLLNSAEPLTAAECQRFGVVDRITESPLEAAKSFLASFKSASWENVRKFKEMAVAVEQLHDRYCFEKEQHQFRNTWRSKDHIESCQHLNRSM